VQQDRKNPAYIGRTPVAPPSPYTAVSVKFCSKSNTSNVEVQLYLLHCKVKSIQSSVWSDDKLCKSLRLLRFIKIV